MEDYGKIYKHITQKGTVLICNTVLSLIRKRVGRKIA
jgi:hypothetical protein